MSGSPCPRSGRSSPLLQRCGPTPVLVPVAELALELGEGLVGDLRYPADNLPVGYERGGELDHGLVLVVEAADETALHELPRQDALEVPLVLVALERRPVGPLGLDLDRPEKSHPSHVAYDGMLLGHPPEL